LPNLIVLQGHVFLAPEKHGRAIEAASFYRVSGKLVSITHCSGWVEPLHWWSMECQYLHWWEHAKHIYWSLAILH